MWIDVEDAPQMKTIQRSRRNHFAGPAHQGVCNGNSVAMFLSQRTEPVVSVNKGRSLVKSDAVVALRFRRAA